MENPFQYPETTPEWARLKEREKRRKARSRRLGREIGQHGGKRPNAGRKVKTLIDVKILVKLTRIQKMILEENGTVQQGIQNLIKEHI